MRFPLAKTVKKLVSKSILILSLIILGISLYFYSEFESKNLAYFIIFICIVSISFSYAKFKDKTEIKSDYEIIEKEMDKIYQNDGIFKYEKNGFYINRNNKIEFLKWDEIQKINVFRIYVLKELQSGLEIIMENKSYEINDNNSPGIEKLYLEINKNLNIDPSWTLNTNLNKTEVSSGKLFKNNIYNKNGFC